MYTALFLKQVAGQVMPVTVTSEEFIGNIARSGLLAAEDLAAFLRQLPPECRSDDAETIAREFVRRGKLTKYQAARLYQGRVQALVLGEYTVLDKIGSGGMGAVFKAHHTRMDRIVALKVIPPDAAAAAAIVERFRLEIRAAAKLMHPNIVTALDAGNHDGIHYLVMEYVDGKDLSEFLLKHGPLSVELAVDCTIQAAQGLHYAHSRGIVHRDVKPGNLLLGKNGVVKVLDMGLARVLESAALRSERNLTVSGGALGTYNYLAPEQAADAHAVDHRADIYSLGCTLYRMLTGEVPYPYQSPVKTVLAHRDAPIPSLRAARAEVPSALDGVFQKMVAKRPADRYQSMNELIADLRTAVKPATTPTRPCAEDSTNSMDPALEAFFEQTSTSDIFVPQMETSSFAEASTIREEQDTLAVVASDKPRASGRQKLVLWSVGGTMLGVLAILLLGLTIRVPGEGGHPKQTKPTRQARQAQIHNRHSKSPEAYVTIIWPQEERRGGRIWIDGQEQVISELDRDRDRLRASVAPGRHEIRIERPGHRPVERNCLVAEGEDLVIEPLW